MRLHSLRNSGGSPLAWCTIRGMDLTAAASRGEAGKREMQRPQGALCGPRARPYETRSNGFLQRDAGRGSVATPRSPSSTTSRWKRWLRMPLQWKLRRNRDRPVIERGWAEPQDAD